MRVEKIEKIFLSQKEADTWMAFSQILEEIEKKAIMHTFLSLSAKLLVICQICGIKLRVLTIGLNKSFLFFILI